ncbi:MAG: RtcB family protein [Planctomycetota bacterium]
MNDATRVATVRKWVSDRLSAEVQCSLDRWARAKDVQHIAVMPDVHLAGDVCIGTVMATRHLIYPAAVGSDIGCGILAIKLNESADRLSGSREAAKLLSALYESVPQNRHRHALDDSRFDDLSDCRGGDSLSHASLEKRVLREGRFQLGTLGRGNHFLEFQSDQQDQLWLMIHSGSRAMGQAITKHHLSRASSGSRAALDLRMQVGRNYWNDMEWARRYAQANRLAMMQLTLDMLMSRFGIMADHSSIIHTDHNHVRRESHFGEMLCVHRKGAQQLEKDELGLVPGSMGTPSYVVAGRADIAAMSSCSHGAGRQLSRSEAKRKISTDSLADSMSCVWFDHRKRNALREEAPDAYKDIRRVMRDQRALVRVVAIHQPLLSFKGMK